MRELARTLTMYHLALLQTANDIEDLRARLLERGSRAHVIAKIETKAAIHEDNLEAIVMASDGIMVARGSCLVEAGAELRCQSCNNIVSLCRKHGKLVIVATQMMEAWWQILSLSRRSQ